MKKIVSLILTAVLMLTLAACGTAQNEEQSTNANTKSPESTASTANGTETTPDNTAETGLEQTVSGDGKILVVYFSWSGNLDMQIKQYCRYHVVFFRYFNIETASRIVFSKASLPYLSTSALFFSP